VLTWDEAAHALDVPQMDRTHREFMALLAASAQASDADFVARLDALIEHTRRHFDNESALMRACGFPATTEHEGDHRRILGELERLRRGCDEGRMAYARHYVEEGLPDWFAFHLSTMDSCLAGCVTRSQA
jgi:hemerythrin